MNALTHIRSTLFQMTQAQFAVALEIDQSTVSRWENGVLVPDLNHLRKIRELAKQRRRELRKRNIEWSDRFFFEAAA